MMGDKNIGEASVNQNYYYPRNEKPTAKTLLKYTAEHLRYLSESIT